MSLIDLSYECRISGLNVKGRYVRPEVPEFDLF